MPHAALEYTNMLGCVPLPIKPLREQKNDIVPSAALYIDTLNQNLGRQDWKTVPQSFLWNMTIHVTAPSLNVY